MDGSGWLSNDKKGPGPRGAAAVVTCGHRRSAPCRCPCWGSPGALGVIIIGGWGVKIISTGEEGQDYSIFLLFMGQDHMLFLHMNPMIFRGIWAYLAIV